MLTKLYATAALFGCLATTVRGDIKASSRSLTYGEDQLDLIDMTDLPDPGNAFNTITGESPAEASATEDTADTTGYSLSVAGITITDVSTEIGDILCIHNNNPFDVYADLDWGMGEGTAPAWLPDSENIISYETLLNGVVQATGTVELVEVSQQIFFLRISLYNRLKREGSHISAYFHLLSLARAYSTQHLCRSDDCTINRNIHC